MAEGNGRFIGLLMDEIDVQAMSTQAPPTSLILFSAALLNNLAFTTTGVAGRDPLPRTLK